MLRQTVLPFKLCSTDEKLTAHAGLTLVAETATALGLPGAFQREFPAPGSNRGYQPWEFGLPLLLMLHGGGRTLEDLRVLAQDEGLKAALGLRIPSSDAVRNWLGRSGKGVGEAACARINRSLLNKTLRRHAGGAFTLDIDATFNEAHKRAAKMSYHGSPGYYPMSGWISNDAVELCVGFEYRDGNESPSAGNLDFIKHCFAQMPKGTKVGLVRSDAAAYQVEIVDWCSTPKDGACDDAPRTHFVIKAVQDASVRRASDNIPQTDWQPLPADLGEGEYAETVHCFNNGKYAFRLVVLRRPYQAELFEELDIERAAGMRHFAIATNLESDAVEVIRSYNRRGQAENFIKELKIGYGMEYTPTGDFASNALWFALGCIAFNLGQALKLLALGADFARHTVATLRWRIYNRAAKLMRHAGAYWLRLSGGCNLLELFTQVRTKLFEVQSTG